MDRVQGIGKEAYGSKCDRCTNRRPTILGPLLLRIARASLPASSRVRDISLLSFPAPRTQRRTPPLHLLHPHSASQSHQHAHTNRRTASSWRIIVSLTSEAEVDSPTIRYSKRKKICSNTLNGSSPSPHSLEATIALLKRRETPRRSPQSYHVHV